MYILKIKKRMFTFNVLCHTFLGLKALSQVVRVDSGYALEHQEVVIDCLEHPDPTIQRKVGNLFNQWIVVEKYSSHSLFW